MEKLSKPALEKVEPAFGSSITYKSYDKDNQNNSNNFWHYHPEIELVYVNGGTGKRQIGSHVSYYRNGDLLLIGPNLPHCGFTDSLTAHEAETVIQFKQDFLGDKFLDTPEMKVIKALIERAKKGIIYHGSDKRDIGRKIEELKESNSYYRLLGLLDVLKSLEEAENYTILNAHGFLLEAELQDNDRINVVFNFVKEEYRRSISLEEISKKVNMTVPAFCRYFKRITGKTFTQFVNEYRLVHAAKLLHEKQMSITDVCFECGFNNFSHFNKQFKKFTGKSPSAYRTELKYAVS